MHGRLFTLFDTPAPSYFVLIFIGFVFATSMGALWAKRVGQNPDVIVDLGLFALLSGFAGSRILHVLADGQLMDYVHMCTDPSLVDWRVSEAQCLSADYQGVWDRAGGVCHPKEPNCFAWAQFWNGGFTFYGGFIGATLAAFWLFKRDGFPFWKACDMGGMMVPIGLGFGRLGCLLSGCCFGVHSEKPWALEFPPYSDASRWQALHGALANESMVSLPVEPTQLYESLGAFLISAFGILYFHERKRYDGHVFVMFLSCYAVLRFSIEFLRQDERGAYVGLSTSQWISVAILLSAMFIHFRRGGGAPVAPSGAEPV